MYLISRFITANERKIKVNEKLKEKGKDHYFTVIKLN